MSDIIDAWQGQQDVTAALTHAVPYHAVPKLLLPVLAAMLDPTDIAMRSFADAAACITALTFNADDRHGLDDASALRHLPLLTALDAHGLNDFDDDEHENAFITALVDNASSLLVRLNVSCLWGLKDGAVAAIAAKMPLLTALDISGNDNVTDGCFSSVAQLSHLTELRCTPTSDAGVSNTLLAALPALTHLSISESPFVNDATIGRVVRRLPHLQTLDVSGCEGLTEASMAIVSKLKELTSLDVSGCDWVSPQTLESIGSLSQLQTLVLEDAQYFKRAHLAPVEFVPNIVSVRGGDSE